METGASPTKPPRMDVRRALLDKDFDRYALAPGGVDKQQTALPVRALEPLVATHTVRKAQWDARVRFNALTADPFLSGDSSLDAVAYFVSAGFELMQVIFTKSEGLRVQTLFQFTVSSGREENVSLQVAGRGLVVYSDGQGALVFLRAEGDPLDGTAWREIYECKPFGDAPTLLLGATYDEAEQRFHVLVTELLDYNDKDAVYRLHVVDLFSAASVADAPMDVDSGAVGLSHVATEIAVLSSLPSFVSFEGTELHVLVEGKHELMIELLAPAEGSKPAAAADSDAGDISHLAHKRHHDESDIDDDLGELLAKLPRAGIGYHGDISDIKHTQELALDLSKPLDERFHKSTTPYSTLDEPLHSAPDTASRSAAAREGKLEVPTTESILGGFEECDDVDPNATAALLRVTLPGADHASSSSAAVAVREKFEINCRKFQFLCPSAQVPRAAPTLLFQHDVHGVLFARSNSSSEAQTTLSHTATLPAFGFVQASKQQKKFVTFHPSGAFACIGEFERRVFVYHGAALDERERESHTRRQHVVELGDQQLLGLRIASDRVVLVLTVDHIVALSV